MTSREIIKRTLNFEHPERVPRDLWTLPIANIAHPGAAEAIGKEFPGDFGGPEYHPPKSDRMKGDE